MRSLIGKLVIGAGIIGASLGAVKAVYHVGARKAIEEAPTFVKARTMRIELKGLEKSLKASVISPGLEEASPGFVNDYFNTLGEDYNLKVQGKRTLQTQYDNYMAQEDVKKLYSLLGWHSTQGFFHT